MEKNIYNEKMKLCNELSHHGHLPPWTLSIYSLALVVVVLKEYRAFGFPLFNYPTISQLLF